MALTGWESKCPAGIVPPGTFVQLVDMPGSQSIQFCMCQDFLSN